MDLKEVASVTGRPGLFKILKPTRTGVVLESLDNIRAKQIINSNTKVSILKDISIYTHTQEGNIALGEIFLKLKDKYNTTLPVNSKSTDKELRSFFIENLPEHDTERVYVSDIKKLVSWYTILITQAPELFVKEEKMLEESVSEVEEIKSPKEEEAKPKKAKAASTKKEEKAEVKVVSETSEETSVEKKVTKAKKEPKAS